MDVRVPTVLPGTTPVKTLNGFEVSDNTSGFLDKFLFLRGWGLEPVLALIEAHAGQIWQ
jgi:hypothetical protein